MANLKGLRILFTVLKCQISAVADQQKLKTIDGATNGQKRPRQLPGGSGGTGREARAVVSANHSER